MGPPRKFSENQKHQSKKNSRRHNAAPPRTFPPADTTSTGPSTAVPTAESVLEECLKSTNVPPCVERLIQAIESGDTEVVKTLIVFGVNTNGLVDGVTPLEKALSWNRTEIVDLLKGVGADSSRKVPRRVSAVPIDSGMRHPSPPKTGLRVLSLDGGGIRCLIQILLLLQLEELSGYPIREMFHYIVGSSAGGILALGIGSGKSVRECLCIIWQLKDAIFSGLRPYSSTALQNQLISFLGDESIFTSVSQYPRLLITALRVDTLPGRLHLFKSYEPLHSDVKRWQTAMATSVAPSYFRLYQSMYIDGGVGSNNPCSDVLTEIVNQDAALKKKTHVSSVLSVGTGIEKERPASPLDIHLWPDSPSDVLTVVEAPIHVAELLISIATETDGQVVERAKALAHSLGASFFRFSPPLSDTVSLDTTNNDRLLQMLY
jgi:predicted acylesterase/phospholipase RssA